MEYKVMGDMRREIRCPTNKRKIFAYLVVMAVISAGYVYQQLPPDKGSWAVYYLMSVIALGGLVIFTLISSEAKLLIDSALRFC